MAPLSSDYAAVIGVLLVAAIIALIVPVGTVGSQIAGPFDDDAPCTETATSSLSSTVEPATENGTRTAIRVEYAVAPNVSEFAISTPSPVLAKTGFERTDGRLVWTGDTPQPTVTLSVVPDSNATVMMNLPVSRADWVVGSTPHVAETVHTDGGVYCTELFAAETSSSLADDAARTTAATREIVYAGSDPLETATRRVHDRPIALVSPEGTAVGGNGSTRAAVLDELVAADRTLDVGCRRPLTLFAVPGTDGAPGLVVTDDRGAVSGWVDENTSLDRLGNTWLHEFVHSRQCFDTAEDMRWFREGSAEYYESSLLYRLHPNTIPMPDKAYRRFDNATLTDPDRWGPGQPQYGKGAKVAYRLDYELRSHGPHTLDDVVAWMNEQEGDVTYEGFRAKVVGWTGGDTGRWMDDHVAGDDPVVVAPELRKEMAEKLGE